MGVSARCAAACGRVDRACDGAIGACGPALFAFAECLVLSIAYASCATTNATLRARGYGASAAMGDVVMATCAGNCAFNHAMCAWTRPGSPKDGRARRAIERATRADDGERGAVGANGGGGRDDDALAVNGRYCEMCDTAKPDMTHHCSVCRRCVLKMDHHCPWVMNCVGARNYRYFFNFIFFGGMGCAWACASGVFLLLYVIDDPDRVPYEVFRNVIYVVIMAGAIFAALALLGAWQAYLVSVGNTTIDYYEHNDLVKAAKARGVPAPKWPFDQGRAKNWQETFDEHGEYWYVAWCLPRIRAHRGSGVYYADLGPKAL